MLATTKQYLTTGQIAQDLGVSSHTVQSWIDRGDLPGIHFPKSGSSGRINRRVHRAAYEAFRQSHKFASRMTAGLVLMVGCEREYDMVDGVGGVDNVGPSSPGVISAVSAFDAGLIVSRCFPEAIVFNWALGGNQATQIASGCASIAGYAPILVALRPTDYAGDGVAEFARCGYHHVVDASAVRGAGSCISLQVLLGGNGSG